MPEIIYAVDVPKWERGAHDGTPTRYEVEREPEATAGLVVYGVYPRQRVRFSDYSTRWLIGHLLTKLRAAELGRDLDLREACKSCGQMRPLTEVICGQCTYRTDGTDAGQ